MFRAEDSGAAAVPEQTDCWDEYASPGLELGYGIPRSLTKTLRKHRLRLWIILLALATLITVAVLGNVAGILLAHAHS